MCDQMAEQERLHRELEKCVLIECPEDALGECQGCYFEKDPDCPRTEDRRLECVVRSNAAGLENGTFRLKPGQPKRLTLPELVAKHERGLGTFCKLCDEILGLNPKADEALRNAYSKLLKTFQEGLES